MEGQVWLHGCIGAGRLNALKDENTKPKRLAADAMLNNAVLKDLLGKTL